MMLLAAIFLLAIVGVYFVKMRHPKNFPPHPKWSLPLLGDSLAIGQDMAAGFKRMHERFGPVFGVWLGPVRAVVVSDLDLIGEVGAKEELLFRPDADYFKGNHHRR